MKRYTLKEIYARLADLDAYAGISTIPSVTADMIRQLLEESYERSDSFRENPASRQWKTSYTKRVVDAVEIMYPLTVGISKEIRDALALLKGYHETQHVVYEQRDAARADLKDEETQRLAWREVAKKSIQRLANVRKALES